MDTGCAIFNPEEIESEGSEDNFARENNLEFIMDMQLFRTLIDKAQKQNKNASPEELLKIFNSSLK